MSRRPELLELLLSPLSAPNQFKVTVTQSPAGEGSADSDLPFVEGEQDWRSTLLRTLELASFKPEYFTAAEQDWMVQAQLLAKDAQGFHPQFRQTIGQVLYRALIPPHSKVEQLLQASMQIAKTRGVQLLVQLKFEADAVRIARLPDYPWELIHNGTGFLLHDQVGFSRYIAFPAVPPSFPAVEQVKLLLIASGASDKTLGFNPLPKQERSAIAEALKVAIGSQRVQLEELPGPTLDELAAYLTRHSGREAPHLLHFDGHGLFGQRCSECCTMHKGIKVQQCQRCGAPLPDAQGYLLFEDEYGDPDYVSAAQLGTLLQQTRQSDGRHQTAGVAALVLSACQSGMAVAGESVFQGTAQNLIYHGVPAVVAMQYSVSVKGAIAFAKQFYRSIGEKNSLAVAVSQGRAMMGVDENQWYRPVLYLRWRDNEGGQFFASMTPSTTNLARGLNTEAVKPYLESILHDEKYRQKWGFYTATDAIGKLQEPQAVSVLDIGLMVQLLQPKQEAQSPDQQDEELPKREKTERLPVLDGIRKYAAEHVLLLGRPGSGKTTALLKLLVDQAQQALADPSIEIPVLVELRYLDADRPSVLERIGAFLQSHDLSVEEATLKAALAEGKLLLLIDGVNELPSESARRAVARFRQDYPKTPMIFTTRDIAIGGEVGIEKKLEMQPLNESQMRQFVQAYLPEQGEPMLRQLQGRLREIGQTPLLLWMLCEVFRGLKRLPSSLGLLFRWFAGEYDKLKRDVPVSAGLRYWQAELLQHLAFTMMQAEQPTELRVAISRQEAEQVLAEFLQGKEEYPEKRAKEWLEDLLEHHLLQQTGQNSLEFHHQLLQEYYAAEALLKRLPQLSDEQLKRDYLNYLKWTEPIALMLTLVEDKQQALQVVKLAIDDVDLMLGARLIGELSKDWRDEAVTYLIERARKQAVSSSYETQLLGKSHSDYAVSVLLKKFINGEEDLTLEAAFSLRELGSRSAVRKLLPILESNNRTIVLHTLYALGKLGDKEIIPNLRKVLNHSDDNIRGFAVKALGELNTDLAVLDLIDALNDQSYTVQQKAVEALGNLGNKTAIAALLKVALQDQSILLSWMASEALKKIDPEQATQELLKALKNETYKTCKKAAEALGKVGSETAIDGLIEALEDDRANWQVASALVEIGGKKALLRLFKLLEHPIAAEQAAFILGELGDSLAVPHLIDALDYWYSQCRERAVEALGKLGDETAIPRLYALLQDDLGNSFSSNNLRKGIIVALGKLGDERVRPELLEILEDQAFGSAYAWLGQWQVFDALEKIGGQPIVQALSRAMESKNTHIRRKSAEVLGNLGDEAAIDRLLTALADENPTVRHQAAEALGKFKSQQVMPKLSPLLVHEENPNIREATIQVLGYLKDEAAVSVLLNALDDPEVSIRYTAANLLAELSCSEFELSASKALSEHWKRKLIDNGFIYPVQVIQKNCKYYNYKLAYNLPLQVRSIDITNLSPPEPIEP